MTAPSMPMISLQGVSKTFNRTIHAVRDVDLDVEEGEVVVIVGPSGSGKSTLLNALAGLVELDDGDITLEIEDTIFSYRAAKERARTAFRRQHIGYVYQFFNLVPTLTVLENVRLPARLNRRPDLEAFAATLLSDFGLSDRLHDFPEKLSGGEQQRVAVARAVLLRPPLLLADEPTGNLDAENSAQIADILFSSCRDQNIMLVLATHSDDIAAMADTRLHLDARSSARLTPE